MGIPGSNPFMGKKETPDQQLPSPGNGSARAKAATPDAVSYNSNSLASALPEEARAKPGDIIDVDGQGKPVYAQAVQPAPSPDVKLVNYHEGKILGLDKCFRCGSTELVYSIEDNALVCQSCRFEDHGVNVSERFGSHEDIAKLEGRVITSGAQAIVSDEVQVTIACQGCGAEVVVDTDKSLVARCHWCRQQLSVNNQIPNGAVPDGIVSFRITKEEAMRNVRSFVSKRKLFANPRFKREFKVENVFGVYLPYVIADAKFTGGVEGRAEEHVRSYSRNKKTYYDYKEYHLKRELAVLADDMSLESSSKRQIEVASNTNNVINAVLPFPIEDAVDFRAHYLTGFNAERRDMNMDELDQRMVDQMLTIVRAKADASASKYKKRGVRWEREWTKLIGAHQASVYLPIWLYSFVEENAKNPRTKQRGQLIHYIAVNGVTGKTMGSIPIAWSKLHFVSWFIGILVGAPSTYAFLLLHGLRPFWW